MRDSQDIPTIYTNSKAYPEATTKADKKFDVLSANDSKKVMMEGVIIEHRFSDGTSMRYQNMSGHAIQYGDIAIADTPKLPEFIEYVEQQKAENKAKTVTGQSISLSPYGCSGYFFGCINPTSNYLWTFRYVPYEFENTVTSAQRTAIIQSIDSWNAKSGLSLRWLPLSSYSGQDRSVIFKTVSGGSSFCGQAYIGYQGRVSTAPFKRDFIALSNNPPSGTCFNDRTIHHEMGHVVGLPHEQTRCDRDQYIAFQNYSEGTNCGNDFYTWGRAFDFSSIMLYDSPAIIPKRNSNGVYNGNSNYAGNANIDIRNESLSSFDIFTMNDMYWGR